MFSCSLVNRVMVVVFGYVGDWSTVLVFDVGYVVLLGGFIV